MCCAAVWDCCRDECAMYETSRTPDEAASCELTSLGTPWGDWAMEASGEENEEPAMDARAPECPQARAGLLAPEPPMDPSSTVSGLSVTFVDTASSCLTDPSSAVEGLDATLHSVPGVVDLASAWAACGRAAPASGSGVAPLHVLTLRGVTALASMA